MLYITSRLYSAVQFDYFQDHELWRELVAEFDQIDASTWKIRILTDVIRAEDAQFTVSTKDLSWLQTEQVVQTAICYLDIQQDTLQTTFTLASASQGALESLQALISNLYSPVSSVSLDNFLQKNPDLAVRLVEAFELKTSNRVRLTYAKPTNLKEIFSQFSSSDWILLNLSIVPEIYDPVKVSVLQIKEQTDQAWFTIPEDVKFLEYSELTRVQSLFKLADIAFSGESQAVLI